MSWLEKQVCKKHKEKRYYDQFQHQWICNSCWAKEHKKVVIYQLRPKPERVTE